MPLLHRAFKSIQQLQNALNKLNETKKKTILVNKKF